MEEEKREEAFLCVRLDVKCIPTGMIRNVGPTFVLVREGVDVLVGSEGRDRVVVTVSVRG